MIKWFHSLRDSISEMGSLRMSSWAIVAGVSSIALLVFFPHQIGVVLTKINLLAIAAWLGYWIDRTAFPYARPDELGEPQSSAAQLRRAVVIAAAMIAMALAL